jgi:hypothetical protein
MMGTQSTQGTAIGRIARLRLDGTVNVRPAEEAFESFVVMLWQMALAQDSVAGWARTCEHLYTIRLFLDRMRLSHLAELASDLMALAGCHAEMGSGPDAGHSAAGPAHRVERAPAY